MADESSDTPRQPLDRVAVLTLLAGLGFALTMAALSDGAYHDDGVAHYLYARWAWNHVFYLVDPWGRPGLTILLFLPAGIGWAACKGMMAVVSIAAAGLAYAAARRLGLRYAAFVPLLCLVQPLFLLTSYGTLTETAMAFYLAAALWLYASGRFAWSAVVLSLCFVTRYESLVLLPVWIMALVRSRTHPLAYLGLLWAPVLHNLMGVVLLDRWPITYLFEGEQLMEYGVGTPLTMLTRSMAASGPAVAVLALVGCGCRWCSRRGWIVSATYLAYLAVHTVVYWLSTHGSGGYPRFLVATSPLAAVAAAHGLEHLVHRRIPGEDRRRIGRAVGMLVVVAAALWAGAELEPRPQDESWIFLIEKVRPAVRWIAAAVIALAVWWYLAVRRPAPRNGGRVPRRILGILAIAATALPLGYFVRPHRLSPDARDLQRAVQWLRAERPADGPVIATNIWASFFLDRGYNVVPPDSPRILDVAPGCTLFDLAPPGTLFIWDAEYSPSERFGITLTSMAQRPGWRVVWTSPPRASGEPFVRIYEFQPDRL
jgi:hypothetical protein